MELRGTSHWKEPGHPTELGTGLYAGLHSGGAELGGIRHVALGFVGSTPKIALGDLGGKVAAHAFRDLSGDVRLPQAALAGDTGHSVSLGPLTQDSDLQRECRALLQNGAP